MTRTYLTYSRDLGDFKFDLVDLTRKGLSGVRLINKGKTAQEFITRMEEILSLSEKNGLNLEILVDLPGEKALIGNIGKGIQIEPGENYVLCRENQTGKQNEIPVTGFLEQVKDTEVQPGDILSIADGEVEMQILAINENSVSCKALNAFFLTSNRSFTVKGNKLPVKSVSDHDLEFLTRLRPSGFANKVKILVSFVTKVSHVEYVKELCPGFHVMSKIESVIPLDDLEKIVSVSDSIMLGRGDLTSTSKMSEVFPFQKSVIGLCQSLNKELILATEIFGDLKNSGKPSISDLLDFGFLLSQDVRAFLIAGSNANHYPFETLDLITNFGEL